MQRTTVLDVFTKAVSDARALWDARDEEGEPEDIMAEALLGLVDMVSMLPLVLVKRCRDMDNDPFFRGDNWRQDLSEAAWENLSEDDGKRILGLQRR
ncbi:MAG: hypothetical protein M0R06_05290 [Sphaerochaeta sp.]|jgi:hypothetical protein|nr:hypothetical protein [Sphaerochaeta sp.]